MRPVTRTRSVLTSTLALGVAEAVDPLVLAVEELRDRLEIGFPPQLLRNRDLEVECLPRVAHVERGVENDLPENLPFAAGSMTTRCSSSARKIEASSAATAWTAGEAKALRADVVTLHVGEDRAEGAERRRAGRHDDGVEPGLLGKEVCVGGAGAAERHQGKLAGRCAAPGEPPSRARWPSSPTRRAGPHRPPATPGRRPRSRAGPRFRSHRLARRVPVEPHAPAEEVLGVNEPGEEIAVRDGRAGAAPTVAYGPRVGARALRADLEHALGIHPEHRTAARADGPDVHHRDDQGIVAHPGRGGVLRLLAPVEREIAARSRQDRR